MSLYLKGLSGSLVDKIIPLKEGLSFGRVGTDVIVADPKASSLHAHIEKNLDGSWQLVDNNSKNGTRINGKPVTISPLVTGMKISIGDHEFEVCAEEATFVPPAPKKGKYWHEILSDFVKKHADSVSTAPKALVPLHPSVILDFMRGPQIETRWVLGYGPRKVGKRCLDLTLLQPDAPDVAFEIIPAPQGMIFKTNHSDVVRLNGQKVDNQVLRVGDSIQIYDTLIEVDFGE